MIYTKQQELRELEELIEETFNRCETNKDEIYWLISLLRGFMNIPNKDTTFSLENFRINKWQYELHPVLEKFKKRWKHSNYPVEWMRGNKLKREMSGKKDQVTDE